MGKSASVSLSLLSLGPEKKLSVTTGILIMDMCFILKNKGMEERHITTVFVLRDRLVVSLKVTITVN